MEDTLSVEAHAKQARAWVRKRIRNYTLTTADDLWNYINKKWGQLPEKDREGIFQKADNPRIIR